MEVSPSSILWAFAMFSRYIRPDAVRVGTFGSPPNTSIAAFENEDGSTVVVMINNGSDAQRVFLGEFWCWSNDITAYYMDNSVASPKLLSIKTSWADIEALLPGFSVVTFTISPR